MKELRQQIVLEISADNAFNFCINPTNTPSWVDGVVVEQTSEQPTKLGTIYKNKDREGNWREFVITAFEPGIMFELTKKDDNHHVRYMFKPTKKNQCELEYFVHVDGDEIRGVFTKETVQKILRKLKSVIEQQQSS